MCDEERALLAAICAEPKEDTPRLAYADWLDEPGHGERAEFIRVQVGHHARRNQCGHVVEPQQTHCPVCSDLFKREAELWERLKDSYRDEALSVLTSLSLFSVWQPPGESLGTAHRGFVSEVTCEAAVWLANADRLTAAHPIERVRLTTWPDVAWIIRWARRPDPAFASMAEQALYACWPKITFEMPERDEWHLLALAQLQLRTFSIAPQPPARPWPSAASPAASPRT